MDAEAGRKKIILVKNFLNISNIIIFFLFPCCVIYFLALISAFLFIF